MRTKKCFLGFLAIMCILLMALPVSAAAPKISKKSVTITVGKTATIKVSNTKTKVSWSSSNKKVATVSKSGKISAKNKGKATITAKVGSKKLKCKVTVKAAKVKKVSKIKLNAKTKNMIEGTMITLKASVTPANATNKSIKWSSSNESIATVSNGKVTANKTGTAIIKAAAKDGSKKTATCIIKVTAAPAGSNSGETIQQKDIVSISATCKLNYITSGQTVSANDFVVYENYSDGTKEELKTYKVSGSYNATDDAWVFVITKTNSNLTTSVVVPAKKVAGNITTAKITGIEVSCLKNEVDAEYKFSISDFSVNNVYSDGTKKTAGNFKVDVAYKDGYYLATITAGDYTKTIKIKVKETETEPTITLSKINYYLNPSSVYVGESLAKGQLKVVATYSDNTTKEITDYTCDFTPKSVAGTYKFNVTWDGKTKTMEITVKDKPIPAVTLKGLNADYAKDKIFAEEGINKDDIVVTATYSDGSTKRITDFTYDYIPAEEHKGKATVVVHYEGQTLSFQVYSYVKSETYSVDVSVKNAMVKINENLDLNNIVVTATDYANNKKVVTDYTCDFTPKSEPGTYKVIINYKTFTLDFDITVVK